MKLFSVICILLQISLSSLYCVGYYWLGYAESDPARNAVNPMFYLPLAAVLFLIVFSLLIRSYLQRKGRVWMTCVTLVFLASVFVPLGLYRVHRPLLVQGLRDRVVQDYGLDDVRGFAREVTQALHPEDSAQGYYAFKGDFAALPAQQQEIYDQFKEKYPFLKWGGDGEGGPTVSFRGDEVRIYWTDSVGQWGFSVTVKGERNDPASNPGNSVLQASDDIYFYAD